MSGRISVVRGNFTRQQVEAIVNAADFTLLGGAGGNGAIHRAAGAQSREYCRTPGGCPAGEARITPAFALPVKWIIHTVGPLWRGGSFGEDACISCEKALGAKR